MYFFDTYAMIEIIKGNPAYRHFINAEIVTTKLNLMELYYWILRSQGEHIAERRFDDLREFAVDIDDAVLKQAMIFRFAHKAQDLSYIDCIGYVLALSQGMKFLTGDQQFKDMENVEFVQ